MNAHWDCLSETCDAGAAGSGAESELGVAAQHGPPQAQRAQQGAFATAASTGRTLCVSATNALNKIAKAAFTILLVRTLSSASHLPLNYHGRDAVPSVPLIASRALSRPLLGGFGLCLVQFLDVFGRVFLEIFEARFAAELNFAAFMRELIGLAHFP